MFVLNVEGVVKLKLWVKMQQCASANFTSGSSACNIRKASIEHGKQAYASLNTLQRMM